MDESEMRAKFVDMVGELEDVEQGCGVWERMSPEGRAGLERIHAAIEKPRFTYTSERVDEFVQVLSVRGPSGVSLGVVKVSVLDLAVLKELKGSYMRAEVSLVTRYVVDLLCVAEDSIHVGPDLGRFFGDEP